MIGGCIAFAIVIIIIIVITLCLKGTKVSKPARKSKFNSELDIHVTGARGHF